MGEGKKRHSRVTDEIEREGYPIRESVSSPVSHDFIRVEIVASVYKSHDMGWHRGIPKREPIKTFPIDFPRGLIHRNRK